MSDLQFTVNAVAPIIGMVLVGYFLKKMGLVNKELAKNLNKLVFKFFLPVMLFLNVYKIKSISDISIGYILYVIAAVLVLFGLVILLVGFITKDEKQKGVIAQAAFRSNYALIGIPLAESIFGPEGGMIAGLLSAVTIPLFNVLAVICLSIYSEEKRRISVKQIILDIIKNPLIEAIAIGCCALVIRMIFERVGVSFRLSGIDWLYSGILTKLSAVATPLALIALGAEFEFAAVGEMKKQIFCSTLLKCVVAPMIGVGGALLIGGFGGAHYAVFISTFGTSIAVSTVPMAQQMGGDHRLAGQLVVWTTVTSALTLFAFIYLLRSIGIF